MTRKQTHAGCGVAEVAEGAVAETATDGASPSATSPGASSAAAHPAHGMAVSVLVVAALFVLTQLYAAIPLLGTVGATMGGDATFALLHTSETTLDI